MKERNRSERYGREDLRVDRHGVQCFHHQLAPEVVLESCDVSSVGRGWTSQWWKGSAKSSVACGPLVRRFCRVKSDRGAAARQFASAERPSHVRCGLAGYAYPDHSEDRPTPDDKVKRNHAMAALRSRILLISQAFLWPGGKTRRRC